MSIQHASIPDPYIHEPKGIASAPINTVYISDGAGSGAWQSLPSVPHLHVAEDLIDSMNVAASQGPSALDTTYQIVFGSSSGSGSDPVMIDGLGNITVNEDGTYFIRAEFQFGRTSGSGLSILHFRAKINGVPASRIYTLVIDSANTIRVQAISSLYNLSSTDVLTFEMVRDPAGNNSGSLLSGTVTAAGWSASSPNSRVVIQRIVHG